MKKLLKDYRFTEESQYYEMIVSSIINGHKSQAERQFLVMNKYNRKEFVKTTNGCWADGYDWCDNFFIDLI